MYGSDKTGLGFMEGFSLLAIALWLGGLVFGITLALMGGAWS